MAEGGGRGIFPLVDLFFEAGVCVTLHLQKITEIGKNLIFACHVRVGHKQIFFEESVEVGLQLMILITVLTVDNGFLNDTVLLRQIER